MSASFVEAPNCQISKGLSIKIFIYFGNRFLRKGGGDLSWTGWGGFVMIVVRAVC